MDPYCIFLKTKTEFTSFLCFVLEIYFNCIYENIILWFQSTIHSPQNSFLLNSNQAFILLFIPSLLSGVGGSVLGGGDEEH